MKEKKIYNFPEMEDEMINLSDPILMSGFDGVKKSDGNHSMGGTPDWLI